MLIVAKIELDVALRNIETITEATDGVMVARGDLGVEMALEKVPRIQKSIIRRARRKGRFVITATQLLESMIAHPRPTRAAAPDVANAAFAGTDAVMLSAETAAGKFPREAVAIMSRIVAETEDHMHTGAVRHRRDRSQLSISETICESVAHAAQDLDMRAIAVFTETGTTARLISKYRPQARIYAFSAVPEVRNRMNLLWGVQPLACKHAPSADDMVRTAEATLLESKAVEPGDVIAVVAGTSQSSGSTNFMRRHRVGAESSRRQPERRRLPRQKPSDRARD
jgi:pyruvate kinase